MHANVRDVDSALYKHSKSLIKLPYKCREQRLYRGIMALVCGNTTDGLT